jgi:hypothetical protein
MKLSRILWIYAIIILILIASAESIDYTPPGSEDIQLVLESGYSPPLNTEINLVLGDIITEPSLNLSFGPAVDTFRWIGCGPLITNNSAEPEGQTDVLGIDYICNNGTAAGNVTVQLNSVPATGWQIYASNESPYDINYCYQESTNVSNQTDIDGTCNLNYDGSYNFSGSFDINYDTLSWFYDGSFAFPYIRPANNQKIFINVNYTKPSNNIMQSEWKVSYWTGSKQEITNITVPIDCINYDSTHLFLKITADDVNNEIIYFCKNDTGYKTLETISSSLQNLYEEAMWWKTYQPVDIDNMYNLTISHCYQESANESNQSGTDNDCSQQYDGSYNFSGEPFTNPENAIDGNFNTAAKGASVF